MIIKVMMYKDNLYFNERDLTIIYKALEWLEGSHDLDIALSNSIIITGSTMDRYNLLYALTALEEVETIELT